MREILFRGFTPDKRGKTEIFVNGKPIKGQWVQGSYWRYDITTYCFKEDYEAHPDNTVHYILFDEMTDWGLPNRQFRADVIPETVGQYTGLTDKNGKRIFEGDFVRVDEGVKEAFRVNDGEIKYAWGGFCVDAFGLLNSLNALANYEGVIRCEVIGNVHDNPELLK